MSYRRLSRPSPRLGERAWHGRATADHPWLRWRLEAFLRLLGELGDDGRRPLRVLEVWCRNGAARRQLEEAAPWTVDGADTDPEALEANPPLRGEAMLYDVNERLAQLRERYDAAILFDVIEHAANAPALLVAAAHHVKPGGRIFVNVPALDCLRGRYDEAAGHLRRYDRGSLTSTLVRAGLVVEATRYWGLPLLPALVLRNAWAIRAPAKSLAEGGFPSGPWSGAALSLAARLERAWPWRLPAGASLLAAARK